MSRSALVAVTALLLVGAALGSVHALPDSSLQTNDGVEPMLTLDAPSEGDQTTQSLDVARASGLQREAAAHRIERYAYETRLEEADGREREVVRDELDRLGTRIEALRSSEWELRNDYVQGRIDTAAYLYGLARIDTRAASIRSRLEDLRRDAAERNVDPSAVAELEARLVGYSGPVRHRLGSAILGEAAAVRVDVQASPNGTVLGMIDGGAHVREASRIDRRTATVTGEIPSDELYGSFTNRLVSEVYDVDPQSTSIRGVGGGTYEAVIRTPRATPYVTITAYVDGDTRGIFSEVQERRLAVHPPRESVTAAANGTRLVVNRSFPGGPLRVATYDNVTEKPISTTVTVNGLRLRTGTDGEAWTLTPRRFEFTVSAAASPGNVSVQVRTFRVVSIGSTG